MFNPSAPLPPLTAGSGLERSNSSLRKDLRRLVSPLAKPNKSASLASASSDMPSSSPNPSHRFSFMKTGMRSLHRKQKSGDSVSSISKEDAYRPQVTSQRMNDYEPTPVSQAPVEPALVELGSVELEYRNDLSGEESEDVETLDRIFEEDNTSVDARSPIRETMFVGLPDYRTDSVSNQSLIDPDFLEKAFGITMEVPEHEQVRSAELLNGDGLMVSDHLEDSSIEVPIQFAKDRRPRIQVSIPEKRTRTLASARSQGTTPSAVSPPSSTRPFNGVATARLSIISSLSVMEMPKPRRPFSAVSLEGMTADMPPHAPAASNSRSASSDDASERDKSSSYSPRSSMSSMASDTASVKQQETRRHRGPNVTPSLRDVASFDGPSLSKVPKNMQSLGSLQSSTPPISLRNKRSASSLNNPVNKNKPLPPEPGQINVAPLNFAGSSRSSTLTVRPQPVTTSITHDSPCAVSSVSRRSSKASTLRSKYTPKDLDALDDAFQRNMPLKQPLPESYTTNSTPTLSQVTLALETQLDTITEDSPRTSVAVSFIHDPLQISRGPMRMEPSRRAPLPPNRTASPAHEVRRLPPHSIRTASPAYESRRAAPSSVRTVSPTHESRRVASPSIRTTSPSQESRRAAPSSFRANTPLSEPRKATAPPITTSSPVHELQETRKRIVKKSASNNHVATQIRAIETLHKRASAIIASNNKANRVLGKTGADFPVRIERKESVESNWDSVESPQIYTTCTSPTMSTEGSRTPESELSSIPDTHFEEIRKRLELLSPKDDPSLTFLEFHEKNASRKSLKSSLKGHNGWRELHTHPQNCPSVEHEIKIPEFIAELEATQISSPLPVELEDTQRPLGVTAELGPNSPDVKPVPTTKQTNEDRPKKGGKEDTELPPSVASETKVRQLKPSRSVKGRSLASLTMSEIPDLYAGIPSPRSNLRPSMTAEEVEQLISADAAERVLLRILQSLDNLSDLFAAATVSRGFYRTFKRHELSLLKGALRCMSPAAWELREMSIPFAELEYGCSDYTPSLYLRHYTNDLLTMIELKSMMLEHCKSFLRAETIKGLAGETDRSPFIDDAFWRVWTFCRIFGCGKGREDDIVGQMDWLRGGALAKQQTFDPNTLSLSHTNGVDGNSILFNPPKGFAKGNLQGLTAEELYDMTEIWTCLGVLIRGYQGKRQEAREYGIFKSTNITPGDVVKENAILEEWTYYLLTLAPRTILDVNAPATPTQATFSHVRSQGYTVWSPPSLGASRSTFLKEAVSRVYEEKMSRHRPTLSNSASFASIPRNTSSPTPSNAESPDLSKASHQRCLLHAAEIRAKRQDPTYKQLPVSEERPMSNYPDVLAKLEAANSSTTSAPSLPKLPALASKILRRQHHPKNKAITPSQAKHSATSSKDKLPINPNTPMLIVPSGPQVRDPVDVAVEKLTSMGFDEARSKKALAQTDSGNSVDFDRAVDLLVKEQKARKLKERLERMG